MRFRIRTDCGQFKHPPTLINRVVFQLDLARDTVHFSEWLDSSSCFFVWQAEMIKAVGSGALVFKDSYVYRVNEVEIEASLAAAGYLRPSAYCFLEDANCHPHGVKYCWCFSISGGNNY